MIDIHCHILPFMDDGAADWDAALAMAQQACKDGVTAVIATPHHANGHYMNPATDVKEAVEQLNEKLRYKRIPLNVIPGQEIRVYGKLLDDLEQGSLLTLGGSRYILLEMPHSHVPRDMGEVCHELIIQGFVPVIAHPERNTEVGSNPAKLASLIELGALGQVTAQSITGVHGSKLKKLSLELCRKNLVHMIASDAHDSARRPFGLSEAYVILNKELGLEVCDYFRSNVEQIISNGDISQGNYVQFSKKRQNLFGIFTRKG